MPMSCPAGQTITAIDSAAYGRTDGSTCPHPANSNQNCHANAGTIRSIVESACLGQASCSVAVNNPAMGGDPCGGTYKYLTMAWTCV